MRQIKLLSRDVDLIKTAENVDAFLTYALEKAVRVINISITDLKSPSVDGLPKCTDLLQCLRGQDGPIH